MGVLQRAVVQAPLEQDFFSVFEQADDKMKYVCQFALELAGLLLFRAPRT